MYSYYSIVFYFGHLHYIKLYNIYLTYNIQHIVEINYHNLNSKFDIILQ